MSGEEFRRRFDRASLLALAAAREALAAAGLAGPPEDGAPIPEDAAAELAISVGTTMGAPSYLDVLGKPPPDPPPYEEALERTAASLVANLAEELGAGGVLASLPAACSAGNYALGFALDLIREGRAAIVLAGAAEAFSESAYAGFSRLRALAPDLCRPFDRDRQGLLLGEGAAFLVVESPESAERRGARALARLLGYGLTCDAHHITAPHPEGDGARRVIEKALEDARIPVEDVGYISCHGTGTRHNDVMECRAIRKALGSHADRTPVSSIKALTGHLMGAASAAEAVSCVLALREGILPPTWNLREQDPECDLDVIPNEPRDARVRVALNNSYAFGGNNACLVLGSA